MITLIKALIRLRVYVKGGVRIYCSKTPEGSFSRIEGHMEKLARTDAIDGCITQ